MSSIKLLKIATRRMSPSDRARALRDICRDETNDPSARVNAMNMLSELHTVKLMGQYKLQAVLDAIRLSLASLLWVDGAPAQPYTDLLREVQEDIQRALSHYDGLTDVFPSSPELPPTEQ